MPSEPIDHRAGAVVGSLPIPRQIEMRLPHRNQALRCLLALPLLVAMLALAAVGPSHAHASARPIGSGIEAQQASSSAALEHDCLACRLAHVKTSLPRSGGGVCVAPEARLRLHSASVAVPVAADRTPSAPRAPPTPLLTRQ
jgi:hypothetical protein